jgi:hypothetical protein
MPILEKEKKDLLSDVMRKFNGLESGAIELAKNRLKVRHKNLVSHPNETRFCFNG